MNIFRLRNLLAALLGFAVTFSGMAVGQQEQVIYSFQGPPTDGADPLAGLIADSEGNLYGTTYTGGPYNSGNVFRLSKSGNTWVETVLYNFSGSETNDGAAPEAPLLMDGSGNLYGTTYYGGSNQGGTVFRLSPPSGSGAWTETILYNFCATGQQYCTDGAFPVSPLIFNTAGDLIGRTQWGGQEPSSTICQQSDLYGCGVVFELSPVSGGWSETVLHAFNRDGTDGNHPAEGALVLFSNGALYGATQFGGNDFNCDYPLGCGTVFKLALSGGTWNESIIYSFGDGSSGALPIGLAADSAGNLYGTTENGGSGSGCSGDGCGVVFELAGTSYQILYNFGGSEELAGPPVLDSSDNIYGVTDSEGASNNGTVFRLAQSGGTWSKTVLHTFTSSSDGSTPVSTLLLGSNVLYGVTAGGGSSGNGTVYQITP